MLFTFILFLSAFFSPLHQNVDSKTLDVAHLSDIVDLKPYLEIAEGSFEKTGDFNDLLIDRNFRRLSESEPDYNVPTQSLKFHLNNSGDKNKSFKIITAFTDEVTFFIREQNSIRDIQHTGDYTPYFNRSTPLGKVVALNIPVPANSSIICYMELHSKSNLSQQFRKIALQSLSLYPETVFESRFIIPSKYHFFFYGAFIIMLFYNFIIFISLKDKSYLYYVFFIFFLIVFLAGGNGHLSESIFRNHPEIDRSLRFFYAPILMISYILFSRAYLKTNNYHRYSMILNITVGLFIVFILCMLFGYWYIGRNLVVLGTAVSFITIFIIAMRVYLKGYTPAKYFLAANSLFIVAGVVYALARFSAVVHNPSTQFILQTAAVIEVIIFSLGLADRFNTVKNELAEQKLENEKLEKEQEIEKTKLIEEKNRELEIKIMERTSEMIEQKEEIETQREILEQSNKQLETAQEVIFCQNMELKDLNKELGKKVKERTKKLKEANKDLKRAILELDHFIYRTAHDIRGPLARLMGLCNVAVLDIEDKKAKDYLHMLDDTADKLNYTLGRLTTVYEIKSQDIKPEVIDFKALIAETIKELHFMEGSEVIDYRYSLEKGLKIKSDKNLMHFIFMNLIENAIKFRDVSDNKNPFIAIKISKAGDRLVIHISDNGKGILKDDHESVFQMFSPTSGVQKTPGLGLFMVKLCVERLNGSIYINPEAYPITEFVISLPFEVPNITASSRKKQKKTSNEI